MNDPVHASEVIYELPPGVPARLLNGGKFLFAAYGCALLERQTAKSYVYGAVNLRDGKTETLCRKARPLATAAYMDMAAKLRTSSIRGAGRHEVDRAPGESLPMQELKGVLNHVFMDILPRHDYMVRENQIELSAHVLEALRRRAISLAESEVGTGKTHAYLIAAVLAKRGRLNDFWLRGSYPDQSYAGSAHMPVVIATSSIALQHAIARDFIPELSSILLDNDVIRAPLTCVVRKGREHYICEKRLREFLSDADAPTKRLLQPLLEQAASCDLADAEGLTPYMKRKICVAGKCGESCRCITSCRYIRYQAEASDPKVDFQITNHNYLLADVLHRAEGKRPLLPHYQLIVIDEAHKFLQAARQMYGMELSQEDLLQLTQSIHNFTDGNSSSSVNIYRLAKKLEEQTCRLFLRLTKNALFARDGETERFPAVIDEEAYRRLNNIEGIAADLSGAIAGSYIAPRFRERIPQTEWELDRIREKTNALQKCDSLICWAEGMDSSGNEAKLCAIPKNLGERLYKNLWNTGVPIVLTSGTLSAGGDFSRVKQSLGLSHIRENRLLEITKASPFDYQHNTLLYLSNVTPFPDNGDKEYLSAVADEVERLVHASHGHAAVLFTSYNAMGLVFSMLKARLPFPMFQMGRRDTGAVERFKRSGNGVLFASGALWEGIDIPGDALSLLIIVKLPFAAPDPIGEYEKAAYGSMESYKAKALVPDMLVKLKQGFGRLIRTETDTGVCAILDSRARRGAAYHGRVLAALPPCRTTGRIADVAQFIREKKAPEYFKEEDTICPAA